MRKSHAIGLLLWRGGLLFAGASALFYGARYALRFMRRFGIEIPHLVEVSVGLILAGLAMVMISLVLERYQDAKRETLAEDGL